MFDFDQINKLWANPSGSNNKVNCCQIEMTPVANGSQVKEHHFIDVYIALNFPWQGTLYKVQQRWLDVAFPEHPGTLFAGISSKELFKAKLMVI